MTHQNMTVVATEGNTPVAYKGVPVMTTERLADAFGADANSVQTNFTRNKDRFSEGVHFFKVTGADLKALKNQPSFSTMVADRAAHLILWTERGAMNHAKILETPEAWAVYGQLVDTYFAVKEGKAIAAGPAPMRAIVSDFRAYQIAAKLFGMDKNQAAISANMAVTRRHGVNLAEDLGATAMIAPQQAAHMTPTQIGAEIGMKSGQQVNQLLMALGFQVITTNSDSRYEPTEKGKPHAVWIDAARSHGNGTSRQLRWASTIIDAIKPPEAEARP